MNKKTAFDVIEVIRKTHTARKVEMEEGREKQRAATPTEAIRGECHEGSAGRGELRGGGTDY